MSKPPGRPLDFDPEEDLLCMPSKRDDPLVIARLAGGAKRKIRLYRTRRIMIEENDLIKMAMIRNLELDAEEAEDRPLTSDEELGTNT